MVSRPGGATPRFQTHPSVRARRALPDRSFRKSRPPLNSHKGSQVKTQWHLPQLGLMFSYEFILLFNEFGASIHEFRILFWRHLRRRHRPGAIDWHRPPFRGWTPDDQPTARNR